MNRLQFYFEHSLVGYFCRRAKQKWFPPQNPVKSDFYGVTLQLDCLPKGMQDVLIAGDYEAPEIEILNGLVSASDQVLEIGAAIGLVGLYCRKIKKVKNLVSVEPNPTTLTYLRKNYDLNGAEPNIIEAALAQTDGPISFFTSDMFWVDSLVVESDQGDSRPITIEGLTFSSIVRRVGFEFNTLIIDVEGAEQYISSGLIPNHVNKILIEIHPRMIGIRKAYGVLGTLIHSGFEIHNHVGDCWALIRS